jgi:hypothetical protein
VPSVSVIFRSALNVSKQYAGLPRLHARHCPQTARQLRITKSRPDRFDRAGGLVAEQEGVVVVDAAVAVGQVRVAHPAGDDVDDGLPGPRVRDDDVHQFDGFALPSRNHAAHCLTHGLQPTV